MDEHEQRGLYSELSAIEPDFERLASYGKRASQLLQAIVEGDDRIMAKKALRVAALIGTEDCLKLVVAAAESEHPDVRSTVAVALRNVADIEIVKGVIVQMLGDGDATIRRLALGTVGQLKMTAIVDVIQDMEECDENETVRAAAAEAKSLL